MAIMVNYELKTRHKTFKFGASLVHGAGAERYFHCAAHTICNYLFSGSHTANFKPTIPFEPASQPPRFGFGTEDTPLPGQE